MFKFVKHLIFSLLIALVCCLSSAYAASPTFPPYTGNLINMPVTTSAINNVIYLSPYSTSNPSGIHTDCSVSASTAINAAINTVLASATPRAKIVLPPGCIGVSSEILIPGRTSWTVTNNPVIELVGAGREITRLKAISTITNVLHHDANYSYLGRVADMTIDGANIATNVVNFEAGASIQFDNLLLKNAATSGKVAWLKGQGASLTNVVLAGIDTSVDFTLTTAYTIMPDYGLYVDNTDNFFTNVTAYNTKIANFYASGNSAGNKYVNVHGFGYGNGNFANYYPQYCFQAFDYQSRYTNGSCDGATVAGFDVANWNIGISNFMFQWQPNGSTSTWNGTANGIKIETGVDGLNITGNAFEQVSSALAINIATGAASGSSYISENSGASVAIGSVSADKLSFNGVTGLVTTPNGSVAQFYGPANSVNTVNLIGAISGGTPSVVADGPGASINLGLGGKGPSGGLTLYSPTTVQGALTTAAGIYDEAGIFSTGSISATTGIYGATGTFAGTIYSAGFPVGRFVTYPLASNTTCTPGDWSAISTYIAVCYVANTWLRTAAATW